MTTTANIMKSVTSTTQTQDITIQEYIVNACNEFLKSQLFDMTWDDKEEFEYETPEIEGVDFILVRIDGSFYNDSGDNRQMSDANVDVEILLADSAQFDVPNDCGIMTLTEVQEDILGTTAYNNINV